mgnify:CR=1 FL=1
MFQTFWGSGWSLKLLSDLRGRSRPRPQFDLRGRSRPRLQADLRGCDLKSESVPASEASLPPEASQVVAEGDGLRVDQYLILKIPWNSTFHGQEDHRHLFSMKLKPFPTFANLYFIFGTLYFVCGWHNLKTAENSRVNGSLDATI